MPRVLTTTGPLCRRTILSIVMAALLLAQALWLVHRVVHAPHAAHAASNHAAHAASSLFATQAQQALHIGRADTEHRETAAWHWLEQLFADHDDSACAAFDQLGSADSLWSHPPELCTEAVSRVAQSSNPAWQLAAQAAGYLARGPPALA